MAEKDHTYLTIRIKRSDVEARFAETGKPASPRSMELIGKCIRETPIEELKEAVLTVLLSNIRDSARHNLERKVDESWVTEKDRHC